MSTSRVLKRRKSTSACGTPAGRALNCSPRSDPEVPAEPDEVGRHFALELLQLGDLAGLDELAQLCLDAPADPAQLADPAGPDQVGDRGLRRPDQLRRTPVRPRCVRARTCELEQGGKRVETLGDRRVLEVLLCGHGGSVTAR